MANHRQLYFKIEKLDPLENVIEEKSVVFTGGRVEVSSGELRRRASLEFAEPIDSEWQARRWKLYYGYKTGNAGDPVYFPVGVFIPINPSEKESADGKITALQGVDKTKLFTDLQIADPVTFASGTTVRSIVQNVAGWVSETKMLLSADLGTLGADLTFEEGVTSAQILNELLTSFNAEWYYDVDGFLVAKRRTDPNERPVKYVLDDVDSPLYISSEFNIDDINYYNKVTLVGGTVDTPIYRADVEDTAAITRAGDRVVSRYFKRDAAVTQDQVDALAAYYLSQGVSLPSQIKLGTLVLPDLEIDDILVKAGVRYEVKQFDIPLSIQSQNINAGEIL